MNFEKIISLLSEPSTYAGLAGLSLVLGYAAEDFAVYTNSFAGLFAFVAIFLNEGK